jgi:hypothetical protein
MVKEVKIEDFIVPDIRTKGKVISVVNTQEVETKFGKNIRVTFNVEINKNVYPVSLIISKKSAETKVIHPRSSAFRILSKYGCKTIKDLIGKEVELELNARGFYRIV